MLKMAKVALGRTFTGLEMFHVWLQVEQTMLNQAEDVIRIDSTVLCMIESAGLASAEGTSPMGDPVKHQRQTVGRTDLTGRKK